MNNKFLILLVTTFLVYACKNEKKQSSEPKKEYAIVSGKATNYSGLLRLTNEEDVYELKINDDGIFGDTIHLKTPDEYQFENAVGQRTYLYLYPGAELNININGDNLEKGISFSGDAAKESNYLIEKKKLLLSYDMYPNPEKELETLQEAVANLEKRHAKMMDNLETSDGLSDAFKALEKKRLHYTLLHSLSEYVSMTRTPENREGVALPERYSKELSNLPINREADYRSSKSYRALVFNQIMKQTNERIGEDTTVNYPKVEFEVIKEIPNEYIRNEVAFSSAEGSVLYTDSGLQELQDIHDRYMSVATNEKRKKEFIKVYESKLANAPGRPSPKFKDYENYKGGTTSLDDFKGKYVFIDVWATWCSPCRAEIPFLEKLEKKYHDKNLTFVSISIDSKRDHDKWKKMVKEENMAGVQLFADKDFDSEFIKAYNIFSIPQFILIDPEGGILNAESPRPSELIHNTWLEEQGL
ncbi:TlpA disulfide reductase family protein [Flavivirga abyssicola]|uniref:TlpA family protein disulfide reductase n=1 Tax=Flavivirga abyssicola TaxID=3063533 RepID=UPI0026DF754F|nr:TlpA disulfide reductase family protein [Flavivirga sp. MEBiC07777]WVK12636.1 TlpA disulfide reductase family protein [Flavivirga sp. MEBiC07777]